MKRNIWLFYLGPNVLECGSQTLSSSEGWTSAWTLSDGGKDRRVGHTDICRAMHKHILVNDRRQNGITHASRAHGLERG